MAPFADLCVYIFNLRVAWREPPSGALLETVVLDEVLRRTHSIREEGGHTAVVITYL